jgi:hypothetical protein
MRERITIPRSTVNIFFAVLAIVVWVPSYYFYSKVPDQVGYHFAAEILKDLGVVIAGLAIVDWLWTLFSGDPVQQKIDQLQSSIGDAFEIVRHARNSGVIRIDSNPVDLDAGFPTDTFKSALEIDLCGMTLHSLFARGDLISTLEYAVKRGCKVRICIASPTNSVVLENSLQDARAAMPGQSASVIEAVGSLKKSLPGAQAKGDLSLYVLPNGVMTAFISRIDQKMLVVPYLRSAFTMNSPAMLLENTSKQRSLFAIYKQEFDYLVAQSSEVFP